MESARATSSLTTTQATVRTQYIGTAMSRTCTSTYTLPTTTHQTCIISTPRAISTLKITSNPEEECDFDCSYPSNFNTLFSAYNEHILLVFFSDTINHILAIDYFSQRIRGSAINRIIDHNGIDRIAGRNDPMSAITDIAYHNLICV